MRESLRERLSDLFYPELVVQAYREGFFPMAEASDGEVYWHSPDPRAIFPLDRLKPPRSLRKELLKGVFDFTVNQRFELVIEKCAERSDTWISDEIMQTYIKLHQRGVAHSIETWQNGKVTGGLYGVSIGGAFFGESMFNSEPNASKACFYFLVDRLRQKGFILLDSQYINDFTRQLGAIEVPRALYLKILQKAIKLKTSFD